ncbi:MAG TPA: ATP-binding protein, partial [Solirubrobacteraceae bacterium]|nr:ATP-binding protein [Solirubrobacteraceae bacterium]
QSEHVDLAQAAVHILRGPRQVGKSTDLKLLVARALDAGIQRRRIVYLSLDLLEDQPAATMVDSIDRALDLAGAAFAEHPRLILLDEVTAARHWRTSIKTMWDDGRIDGDVVLCTGSSAIDLAEGTAERLPGRRGSGHDILILPQDFGSFARALDSSVAPCPALSVGEILTDDGKAEIAAARVHLPALQRALERYLLFGGLPAAVAEAVSGRQEPSEEVERVLWDSLTREIQRRGASVPAAQALLERIMRSLGAKMSWSKIARELAVPLRSGRARDSAARNDPRTVQSYVEMLTVNYFAMILYFWKGDSQSADLAKDKKIYFGDPLLHTITARRTGVARDRHADVENTLALALYRRYEPSERSAESFVAPERLHVWGTRRGGEIDFVCGPRDAIEAVEVADWARVNRQKATAPMRALPRRAAIVATRENLEFSTSANLLPAALLLWALSG